MDCHFLLQGIFLTRGSNPGLPHCTQTLYRLSHQGECKPVWMPSNSLVKLYMARPKCMSCTPRPCVNWKWVHTKKKKLHREFKTLVYIWGQNLGFLTSGSALVPLLLSGANTDVTNPHLTTWGASESLSEHSSNPTVSAPEIWLALLCLNTSFHGMDPSTWVLRAASPQHWPPLLPSP